MYSLFMFLIGLYGIGATIIWIWGIRQTCFCKNPYGLTQLLAPYGIFVWGDAVMIGFFWMIVTAVSIWLQNMQLFFIVMCVFWMVRSAGEIMYWFLQQFAETKRDKPESLWCHSLFPGESIWFAYQLFWQLVLVVSSVCLIYLVVQLLQ